MVAVQAPPTPDTCEHPAPVTGVLTTEFAHYDGAQGPEGTRRTVTFYGPVLGGLPVLAWHCESCGLLKVEYPDGRREERRLYPGPQPGLLRASTDEDHQASTHGRQERVSGFSMSRDLLDEISEQRPAPVTDNWFTRRSAALRATGNAFYALNGWTQFAVVLFLSTLGCLLALGILTTYSYATPSGTGVVVFFAVLSFALGILAMLAPVAFPLPTLAASPPDAATERVPLPAALRTSVGFLTLGMIFGFVAAVLAVYDYVTSPYEAWFVLLTVFSISLGVTIATAHFLNRKVMPLDSNAAVSATTLVTLAFSAVWAAAVVDYTGLKVSVWFTTLDAWLAIAGVIFAAVAALLYAIPTSLTSNHSAGGA